MTFRHVVVAVAIAAVACVPAAVYAGQETSLGSDTAATVIGDNATEMTLTGYIREGRFRNMGSSKSTKYIYLHLTKPFDIFSQKRESYRLHAYDVQLLATHSKIVFKLESLVGHKVSVRGDMPFNCVANCDGVIPMEPVMLVRKIIE